MFRPCGENQPTTQRSGRGLERRHSEMSELCRRRQSEEYGACADEMSSPPLTPPRNAGRDKGLRDLTRLNLWLCERRRTLPGPSNRQKMPVLRGFPGHPLWI